VTNRETSTSTWLAELQPALFYEVSPALAADRGRINGGWGDATLRAARAEFACRVLATRRIRPLHVGGTIVHQIRTCSGRPLMRRPNR